MSTARRLPAGANTPIDGRSVTVTVRASDLGGLAALAEEGGRVRALRAGATLGDRALTLELAAVPDAVERVRVFAWSSERTRLLVPVEALVAVDGREIALAAIDRTQGMLRAAELVEVYRRHGAWKLRAVASGWDGGLPAMAAALGIEEGAIAARAGGAGATARRATARDRSPPVGPPELRPHIDAILGPGDREGDQDTIGFELGGVPDVRVALRTIEDMVQLTALLPAGRGTLDATVAETALRVTGDAPMGRIAFAGGEAWASASTVLPREGLDTAPIKALLAEAWATAEAFLARVRSHGWRGPALTPRPPRELRLGVAEELGPMTGWQDIHEMLLANGFMPLVDAPQACLLPVDGTMWMGPVTLRATPRAWAVLCERVLAADLQVSGTGWRAVADLNQPIGPMRVGIVREAGVDAPSALVCNFSGLQVPRTNPARDLEAGLSLVDDYAADVSAIVARQVGGSTHRNNLPWPRSREWSGPGREIAGDVIAREIAGLPDGAGVPPDLLARVRARSAELGRGGAGYLAHLALLRAEQRGPAAQAWAHAAADLVRLAPTGAGPDPTATASVHVRLERLQRPLSSAPPPRPAGSSTAPPRPARRRRWFGGGE